MNATSTNQIQIFAVLLTFAVATEGITVDDFESAFSVTLFVFLTTAEAALE